LTSLRPQGESARANRQDVIAELNTQRASARTLARLERKRAQAEAMGQKERAVETGEDLERTKNWEYSIEDNERWDKKQARKARRADQGFTGACDLLQVRDRADSPPPAGQTTTTSRGGNTRS